MRHRVVKNTFGRKTGPRKALVKGLVTSLVERERIRTTLPKAKELRRHVERAVTIGKTATLHARRILLKKYANNTPMVSKIIDIISPRFKDRPGGYTRIIKLENRPGDNSEMAFIEFVDYDYNKPGEALIPAPSSKEVAKRNLKKRKGIRKVQEKSRIINRK
ncbi:MAG: 50S ribosomal protein L17 [Bdellovibrionaceae bacterium]|nr:50S ribosomal protein L17 [Pseudobdellovibrionaceae bacterium]